MTLSAFHFIRPYWLLLLLPLAWLGWRLLQANHELEAWRKVCDTHLLPALLINNPVKSQRWPLLLLAIAWLLAVFAMAGPSWSQVPQAIYRQPQSLIIALDLSQAMLATDLVPNRIERVKYKVLDLLKANQEGQTGLIVFAAEPYTVSPLTQDTATIAALVPELSPELMPIQGQKIGSALVKAGELLKQAKVKQGEIFLLSASPATTSDYKIAKQLAQQGYKISVLGVGTTAQIPSSTSQGDFLQDTADHLALATLPVASLRQLADVGGGIYISLTPTNHDIEQLLAKLRTRQAFNQVIPSNQTALLWWDEGRKLVFPVLLLALCAFRRGWLREICP